MRFIVSMVLALSGLVLVSSCRSSRVAKATWNDLNGTWSVVELNGQEQDPAKTRQQLVLDMEQKRLSGHAGCNRMMGSVEYSEAQKGIIKFPQVATTRMACPDMEGEQALLKALDKVVRFESQSKEKPVWRIALYGTDNSCLMVLEKQ